MNPYLAITVAFWAGVAWTVFLRRKADARMKGEGRMHRHEHGGDEGFEGGYALLTVFIFPSQRGVPPRAIIGPLDGEGNITGDVLVFSHDLGCWCDGGMPIPMDVGEMLTERSKRLGVKW